MTGRNHILPVAFWEENTMEERKLDMENLKTVSDEKEEHSVLEKKIGRTRYHVHLFLILIPRKPCSKKS